MLPERGCVSVTITMYSRPASECQQCWSTEKRFAHYKIPVKKVLLDGKTDQDIVKYGYTSAPVVVVTDDSGEVVDHWSMFRESKIAAYKGA